MSNVSKYIFGKNKLGRMKRILECDSTTYDGVQWIPNYKGSQRGAVLKTTNDLLLSHGMRKRSQIDSINSQDISNFPFKRIMKILNQLIDGEEPFLTSFMIPEQDVITVEIFFRGKFCNEYIEFSCDENNSNFIISAINFNHKDAQKIIEKSNIKIGYRVIKVKGIKVINKKYNDILKMIINASNDLRIDYSILFEQGEIDWYNIKKPHSPKSNKTHLKQAKTLTSFNEKKRRKSGNYLPSQKSSNNKASSSSERSKHFKKTKSFDFGKKSSKAKAKRSSRTLNQSKISAVQIGKIVHGSSQLGQTRREIECDCDTFIDVDFVPNYKGSQRGAVLKRTNEKLLRRGLIKKTQIDSINGTDVSSASYHNIIHALNEYISREEIFNIAFMIPERQTKTVEIFFRGLFMEYMDFIADENGNNCIIKKIKSRDDISKTLINKCKLSPGYRITKIKTKNVTNKKFNDIKTYLIQSSKDMRVQYLVVFEQGELGWYGYEEKDEKEEDEMPLAPPQPNHFDSTCSTGSIIVNDKDMNVIDTYGTGIPADILFDADEGDEDDEDSHSGYEGSELENSMIIHSSEDEEEEDDGVKQQVDDDDDKVIHNMDVNDDKVIKQVDDDDEEYDKPIHKENKSTSDDIKPNESKSDESIIFEQMAVVEQQIEKKEFETITPKVEVKKDIDMDKKEEKEIETVLKNEKKKDKNEKNEKKDKKNRKNKKAKKMEKESDRDRISYISVRKRFIAKIKHVCIAVPFDPNQTLLSFQREISFRISNHKKLRKDKNLLKRIKYIKLQTPNFPMLIDCDPSDKLCDIASAKDMIIFHTQSDDEFEEPYWD